MKDQLRSQQRDVDSSSGSEREGEEGGWPGKAALTDAMTGSSGQALPGGIRGELEGSLGADLSAVRVHTDAGAEKAAAGVHAKAFTHGQSIFFNRGFFNPGSRDGKKLLAHEVAHTVQQRGATTGGPTSVSSPGDAHELQAEAFGDSFLAGRKSGGIGQVSRGVISRAVIQRDLLDGSPPANLSGGQPINAQQPNNAEISEATRTAIRNARSGGAGNVVAIVNQLRSGASGGTKASVESAILSELTAAEKTALTGGKTEAGATGQSHKQEEKSNPKQDTKPAAKTGETKTGDKAGENKAGDKAGENKAGEKKTAEAGGGGGGTNQESKSEGGATGPKKDGEKKEPEAKGEGGGKHPAEKHPQQHAGGENAGAEPAGAEPAGAEPAIPEAQGKELIEQELSFHEKWRGLGGGQENGGSAGQRALSLGKGLGTDLGKGLVGGLKQAGIAQVVKLATNKTLLGRIPGVGNIIGGGFAAYNLFSHGGDGIRRMGNEAVEGIGGAFSAKNWKESPFLTAANLIMGIKSVLEIIGNVCQILSGLAYAFAAIAALGGLLSIFFPPLAFLVPYIPMAINFGRACGGIATVALNVATMLSPLPPVLRAIHIIFSNQDPLKLVSQEEKFHEEAQGAIANYTANRVNAHLDGSKALHGADAKVDANGKALGVGASLKAEFNEGLGQTKAGIHDLAHGSQVQTEALGTTEADLRNPKKANQIGKDYFNPDKQAAVNKQRETDRDDELGDAEKKLEHRQERLDEAKAGGKQKQINSQQQKYDRSHHNVEKAEGALESAKEVNEFGGRQATAGNTGDIGAQASDRPAAREEDEKRDAAQETANEVTGYGPHQETRNAHGHVQLPEPPGSLKEIEALDDEIKELREAEHKAKETATAARKQQSDSSKSAAGLTQASQGVQQHLAQNQQRNAQGQAQITAQTSDMQNKSTQANTTASGGTNQAASGLGTVAAGARAVDGILGRIPSNKFFDISSTKNNVHQFVVGLDQVTGAGPQQQQQAGQVNAVSQQRQQQAAQAAAKNASGVAAGQQVHQMMTQDAGTARTAASSAGEIAATSLTSAQQAGQTSAQKQQERTQKWQQLLAWAAQHRQIRAQATREGGE